MLRRSGPMVLASLLVCAPRVVRADPETPAVSAADQLFDQAKELLRAGDWTGACAEFHASMDLDAAVGTLLKIAKCDEHRGKLTLALHDYRAALELNRTKPNQTDARRAELEAFTTAAIAQLEPRIPALRVTLSARPAGVRVTVAGEELPLASLDRPLPFDPGPIEIVAEAPGYGAIHRAVVLAESGTVEVVLVLAPAVETRAPPAPPPAHDSSTRRAVGLVLGGVGVVGLGLGGWFALQAAARVNDATATGGCVPGYARCDQRGADLLGDARVDQTVAIASLAAGAVALGVGIYFVVTAPRARTTASARLGVGPSGCTLTGVF